MKNAVKILLFVLAGAGFGYLYYVFFGCRGSCPITSDPVKTMVYFAAVGGLISVLFLPEKKKAPEKPEHETVDPGI